MKFFPLILALVFSVSLTHCQTPQFEWAKNLGGKGDDRGNCITTDAKRNVIIAGRYRSSSINFGKTTLINSDSSSADIFIIKLNSNGKILWAKSLGGKGDDDATACRADRNGNIAVAGWFECTDFIIGKSTLTNVHPGKGCDFFIAKFSEHGECIWANAAGGKGSDGDYSSCSIDAKGNILVSGIFNSSEMDFGDFKLYNSGSSDMFIAKYSTDGKIQWAKNAIGSDSDEGQSCSMDAQGNIFAGGFFNSPSLTFDSIILVNTEPKSGDAFIVKYNPDGNVLWAKNIGGTETEIGNCFTDPSGNTIMAGIFFSPTIKAGQTTLTNAGGGDIFLIKFNPKGEILWAKSAGGNSMDGVRNFYVDNTGNILITGSYSSPILIFGKDTLKNIVEGTEDIFLAKYDPSGNFLFAKTAGGAGRNCGRGITSDSTGNIFLTGSFEESSIVFGKTCLKNFGSSDIFVLKMSNKKKNN